MMPPDNDEVFQKSAGTYEPRGRLDPAGFAQNIQFRTIAPSDRLRPFLEHFWIIRWDIAQGTYHSAEVMHRPYVDAFLSADRSGIQGTFRGKRVYPASGSGRIIGARFLPGAFRSFWDGRLVTLQNRILPLPEVFSGVDAARIARILDCDDDAAVQGLVELLLTVDPRPDDNIALINKIIAAVETEDGPHTVAGVAAAAGRSERWLQQLFRDYLGIGLKWFLQRQRLLAAAALIRATDAPDWAGIAYDLGYSSQQHFITDFRKVLDETPVQYKASTPSNTRPLKFG